MLPTHSAKKLLVTCSPSTMPLGPPIELTSSSTQFSYRLKNISPSPNRPDASQPVQQFSSSSQISSTASPLKPSSTSSLNHSQKCSHSPHSSTNTPQLSTTSGPMAHGALYSWKRASARATHSLLKLHPLLLPTSSNYLTLNYAKEPQLASSTETLATMVLEALHISLNT